MTWLLELIKNPYLLTGISSWLIAQVLKTIIHAIIHKKLVWERLFGDGGMPSGHSATVTSMAVFCGLRCGFGSFEFAMAAILAVIVCHDAMGVRLETGKQAEVINEIVELLESLAKKEVADEKLKTFVGHTPMQVIAGITLGIVNAIFMNWILH